MSGLWGYVYVPIISVLKLLFSDDGVDQLTADDGLTVLTHD